MTLKAVVLFLLPFILGLSQTERLEREFSVTPGQKLQVDLKTGGSLHITGWDKNIVSIKGRTRGRDADECKVEIVQVADGVRISSYHQTKHRSYNGSVDFEINVPKKFDLDLESMGGGYAIENVEGRIEGKTMGGPLTLTKLKGNLDLITMGGKITLRSSEVDGRVKTMGGEVLVEDVTGNVKATSMGGKVIQRNVKNRSGEGIENEVNIRTMGGDITVDDAPEGADVHTMGGNIYIQRASKHARAKTMGGNIEIDAVDGSVQATTMGGEITVTMVGDPAQGDRSVAVESMGGDVTVTVPAALSMELDLALAYTKDARERYEIVSDFDVKREETKEWDRSKGSPRRYIYASGSIAGGKNKVRIKTVNGNIYLRKG